MFSGAYKNKVKVVFLSSNIHYSGSGELNTRNLWLEPIHPEVFLKIVVFMMNSYQYNDDL
jgi:predicted branched-subunit amino acid permease